MVDRPSYLWEPLPGDPGAHGIFGDLAHERSVQYTLATHRGATGAGALVRFRRR